MFQHELSDYWIKLTFFETVLVSSVHRHIYTLFSDNCLLVYKYWEDSASKNVADVNQIFFWELSEYLRLNKLVRFLTLEVLQAILSLQSQMLKFVLAEQETIIIEEKTELVAHRDIHRVTDWSFTQKRDSIVFIKKNKTHTDNLSEEHQIFTNEKPLRNIDAVLSLLLQKEVSRSSH